MIVRPRPHWLGILFAWHGSVLPRIVPQLGLITLLALAVTLSHGVLLGWKVTLTPMPFTLVGIANIVDINVIGEAGVLRTAVIIAPCSIWLITIMGC